MTAYLKLCILVSGCLTIFASVVAKERVRAAPGAANAVPSYPYVRRSIALIAAGRSGDYSIGTAFCLQSNRTTSFFLTNAHVVGADVHVKLRLESDRLTREGVVIKRGPSQIDAALIEVQVGAIPPLTISARAPDEGQPVAVAGYPSFQLEHDRRAWPSVHAGIVNALFDADRYIEHDALQDHGNSGGPLFDPVSGVVYGLVTYGYQSAASPAVQNNVAIAMAALLPFLQKASLAVRTAEPRSGAVGHRDRAAARSESPGNVAGHYRGNVMDNQAGIGSISLTLTQSESSVTGTWQTAFADARSSSAGTLRGSVIANGISAKLTPGNRSACPYHVSAIAEATRLQGTYAAVDCATAAGGSFTVDR